jgi:RNA polymerase sigma-70 factor (ECF subfamily)
MTTRPCLLKGAHALAEEIDWEAIYREYLPRVYNFFRYRLGDRALAEDLTAANFEKAWRGRSRFRREAIREQADPKSLEETVQRNHDFARLSTLLSQLSAREREVIAFKYGAGLNNREIADLTCLSPSNVGIILYRVVEKLRAEMEDHHE